MGSSGNKSESEAAAELESSDMVAMAKGFDASLAKRRNAGTSRTASAAAAIILTLNLIVAS
jgi:hypothetical protein